MTTAAPSVMSAFQAAGRKKYLLDRAQFPANSVLLKQIGQRFSMYLIHYLIHLGMASD